MGSIGQVTRAFAAGQSWGEQDGQDGDDRNDNHELGQSERARFVIGWGNHEVGGDAAGKSVKFRPGTEEENSCLRALPKGTWTFLRLFS